MADRIPTPFERAAAPTLERIHRDRDAAPSVWVGRILRCVGEKLFRPGFNVAELRTTLGLRDNTVAEQFRSALGVNLRTYLEDCRLETSCRLLLQTDMLVGRIARLVGYQVPATFSRAFCRRLGCLPSAYRSSRGRAGRRPGGPGAESPRPSTPRLPRFLAGIGTVSERDRCHRCRVPLSAGRGARVFENLCPICDLCAHEHGPPQLSRLLKECIVDDDATAEDHIRRLVFQKAGSGRRRQLSPADAESLIWALLCLYPDSLEVVREHVDTRVRRQREQVGRPLPPENPDADPAVDPMTDILQFAKWLEASEGERVRALEVWRAIEHLSRPRQEERIRRLQPPFVTDALFVLLQCESRDCIRDHPRRSLELAELALAAVEVMDRTLIGCARDLDSDAWAWLANARRAACDLRGADEALTTAYGFYHEGSRTTLRLAKLLDYEGSLRRDQRRFDHALVCLDRALEIYRNSGAAPHLAGKILIKRATVYDQACQPDRAVPLLRQALALIDSEIEPCLLYSAYQNLGVCLCEIERYDEAARLLPLLEDLVAESDRRMDRARLEWLRGRISSGTGDGDGAIPRFKSAQSLFLETGAPYDAALVALDLAAIHADAGRNEEASAIGRWIAAHLRASEFNGEAVAALSILERASESNDLSADLLARLRKYLKQARFNRDLRFDEVA